MKKILFFILIAGIFLNGCGGAGIEQIAEKQILAFRNNEIREAYDSYFSETFKGTMDFESFQEFLKKFPGLINNENFIFKNKNIDGDNAHLEGILILKDGSSANVLYDFVKENGDWKVLYVSVQPILNTENNSVNIENTEETGAGSIVGIAIGDMFNDQAVVPLEESKKIFYQQEVSTIYLSVYMHGAKEGASVVAGIIYVPTNDRIGPVPDVLSGNGDMVSNFTFGQPKDGWPKGEYQVKILLSTGEEKEESFFVE